VACVLAHATAPVGSAASYFPFLSAGQPGGCVGLTRAAMTGSGRARLVRAAAARVARPTWFRPPPGSGRRLVRAAADSPVPRLPGHGAATRSGHSAATRSGRGAAYPFGPRLPGCLTDPTAASPPRLPAGNPAHIPSHFHSCRIDQSYCRESCKRPCSPIIRAGLPALFVENPASPPKRPHGCRVVGTGTPRLPGPTRCRGVPAGAERVRRASRHPTSVAPSDERRAILQAPRHPPSAAPSSKRRAILRVPRHPPSVAPSSERRVILRAPRNPPSAAPSSKRRAILRVPRHTCSAVLRVPAPSQEVPRGT